MPDTEHPHFSSRRLQPGLKRLLGLSLSLLAGCSPLSEPGTLVSAPAEARRAVKQSPAASAPLIILEPTAAQAGAPSESSSAAPKLSSSNDVPDTQTLSMAALSPQMTSFTPAQKSESSKSSNSHASRQSSSQASGEAQLVSKPLADSDAQPESADPATDQAATGDSSQDDAADNLSQLDALVSGDPIRLVSDEILPGSKGDRNGILPGSKGDRIPLTSLDVELRRPVADSFSIAQADAPETQDWQVSLDGGAPARVLLLGSQTSGGEERIWLRLETIDYAEEVSLHELTFSSPDGVLQAAALVASLSPASSQLEAPLTSTSLAEWMVARELQQDAPVQAIDPALLAAVQADPEIAELAANIAALQLESKGEADPSKAVKLKGQANAIAHRLLNQGKGNSENNGGSNNGKAESSSENSGSNKGKADNQAVPPDGNAESLAETGSDAVSDAGNDTVSEPGSAAVSATDSTEASAASGKAENKGGSNNGKAKPKDSANTGGTKESNTAKGH